jgi:hypothetical protein
MVNARAVRLTHSVLFVLITICSIIALAISASLVAHYNNYGYPPINTNPYRDRIRICLAAGIWSTFIGCKLILRPISVPVMGSVLTIIVVLTVGFQVMGENVAFGILTHLVPLAIAFILFIIGAGSLTALTNGTDCGDAVYGFDRCNIVKGLVIISWIDT